MADIIRYVNTASTAGGDGTTNATTGPNRAYPSLASWNTAEATNLVIPNDTHTVYCTGGADSAYVLMSGWTLSATNYVRIIVLQANRHNGTAGTGYRLTHASGLDVYQNYVRIEGLALRKLMIGSSSGAASDVRVDGCLIEGTTGIGLSWDGGIGTLRNSIIQNTTGDGLYIQNNQSPPTLLIVNCTVGGCGGYGINRASGTATAKSCYAGGNTTADWNGTITRTKCGSSDTTGTPGLTSLAYSTANFVNVTAGSQNLHLVAGSALIDAGDGPSADADIPTTDIDGHARSGTTADLGADELSASGITLSPGGISSTEAFGAPALTLRMDVAGIASAELLGTPALSYHLLPIGILSGEVLGLPVLTYGLAPVGIGSIEAFGTPALSYQLVPIGINSTEAFGTPSLDGSILLSAVGISSTEAFGTPALTYRLDVAGIASAELFGTPALNYHLLPIGILPGEALGLPVLTYGLAPLGIGSIEAFGTPSVLVLGGSLSLFPSGIPSSEAFGTPAISIVFRGARSTSVRVLPHKTDARVITYA